MRVTFLNIDRQNNNDSNVPIDIEFTAPLILHGDPVNPKDAATKQYVDASFLSLNASYITGGTLSVGRMPAFTGDVTNLTGTATFTLTPTGVTANTYTKVTVDAKGRVIGGSYLTVDDIPLLPWSKITKDKPTTLAGYGITDGIKITGDLIDGSIKSNAVPTNPLHAINRKYIEDTASLNGGLVYPGTVITYPSITSPSGYLRCNGAEVSKDMYSNLYAAIGDKFGYSHINGNGSPWYNQWSINYFQTDELGTWSSEGTLSNVGHTRDIILTKNRCYFINALNQSNNVSNKIYYSDISQDGTIGPVTETTPFPVKLHLTSSFVYKNKVFVTGGSPTVLSPTPVTSIYTANINNDGSLGEWVLNATTLPIGLHQHASIIIKNRLYLIGGFNSVAGTSSSVYRATLSETGELGNFTSSGYLPEPLDDVRVAVIGQYIYTIGGGVGLFSSTNKIYRSTINADGSLSAWTQYGTLPIWTTGNGVFVTNKRIYSIAGSQEPGVIHSSVYSAPINPDGTIGTWTQSPSLPISVYGGNVFATNSKLYYVNGIKPSGANDVIYSTPIAGITSDYSVYYNDNITTTTSPNNFRLPDFGYLETFSEKYYIKF